MAKALPQGILGTVLVKALSWGWECSLGRFPSL